MARKSTKSVDEKEVIEKYGTMFNPKNIDNLTAEDFLSFLKYENNKHWDGLLLTTSRRTHI